MKSVKEEFQVLKSKRLLNTRQKTMNLSRECIRKTLIAVAFLQSDTSEALSFGLVTESVLNDFYNGLRYMPKEEFKL